LGLTAVDRYQESAVEAVLMVADEPVPSSALAAVLECSVEEADILCSRLAKSYESEGRGFALVFVAGGWRFQSHPDLAEPVLRFARDAERAKLSPAALETLAVIAYKQPVSKAQIAAVRGVDVDGVVRNLVRRGYIHPVGNDPGPGQALLYGTTPAFLSRLGLGGLSELPAIGDFVPGADALAVLEEKLRSR
jgi:segregation and condensation protein B